MTEKMHADELEIEEGLVRRLLVDQFPHWAELPLRKVEPVGTVNAVFRLGDEYCIRLARREGPKTPGGREFLWLPKLASSVPLEIPIPIAQGRPNNEYPWFWEIHSWLRGEIVPIEAIDEIQAARDLARFVLALQQVDSTGGPLGRGIPLAQLDKDFRYWLARFNGDPAVSNVWESALSAPPWNGPPVWHHGDLDVRNWLVRDKRISGVIDWETMGIGDPACDVMVAWKLHSPEARDVFLDAIRTDDATLARARGWVVSQAVAILAYYTPQNNQILYNEAKSWLDLVLVQN
ncbi:Predicted kinase, aminoglycoside phosphotransferase (APT) family [Fictibacillus enclensis]|uniref:Aminoglycoside phosphotransferase n=1 Tax=Fictibacillus enclensis TaxID=1017270 RepID=A0A0V8JG26_9BACL|nr:aminoglycoside phosphotransferase family protein [Fictibacillus enclensis]KSU85848.1 aminoglycoside phosphotransferase [Fictibacillus enclensis]SCC03808.1 Predicted kinase, aminoglycoside phosphotransferase (APT) family [Fictibacillus enclensis]